MANVRLNPVLQSVRGKVGDLIFSKRNGGVFISRKSENANRIVTPAQQAVRDRFRQAALYGKAAMADPQVRALYAAQAKKRKRPIFSVMIENFFKPPSVEEIDMSAYTGQAGSTIGVRASDDFDVMAVDVAIFDASNVPIESGAAEQSANDLGRWVYTLTTPIPSGTHIRVEVTATDRPGHKTTRVENL
jgi:hypothetical protein